MGWRSSRSPSSTPTEVSQVDNDIQLVLVVAFVVLGAYALGYNPIRIVLGVLTDLWNAFINAIADAVSNALNPI